MGNCFLAESGSASLSSESVFISGSSIDSPFWYLGESLAVDLPADFPLGAVGRAGVLC